MLLPVNYKIKIKAKKVIEMGGSTMALSGTDLS